MASHSTIRISKEITNIQKGTDLSIAVAFRDENIRKVRALIIGPSETPYEFGFFEFRIIFPREYPETAPEVKAITTNRGKTRFNPNVYAQGKVCLSILGTWRGESGEEWSSAQGLESVLISIQSLMSSNPYENEPGFETQSTAEEKKAARLYASKIRHETIRVSVLDRLETYLGLDPAQLLPAGRRLDGKVENDTKLAIEYGDAFKGESDNIDAAEPFADLCKRRFLWYYESYLASIDAERKKHGDDVQDRKVFPSARFEHPGNNMSGTYAYADLERRLKRVRKAIDQETQGWADKAMEAKQRESPVALNFENKFKHVVNDFKQRERLVDFEMVNGNPCVWQIILFGKPMTNLDGGIFRIRVTFPLTFPDPEKPRVVVETPIFHSRVAKDGTLCYFPRDEDDIASHIEAIMEAIETESPPYDPRTLVNAEAAKLCWGSAEDKKVYNRKLRRSAQESSEYL